MPEVLVISERSRLHCTSQLISFKKFRIQIRMTVPCCAAAIISRTQEHGVLIEMPSVTEFDMSRRYLL